MCKIIISLRIGSLSSTYFSIDNHPLTIVEADGTSVEPKTVNEIFLATAQVCLIAALFFAREV